MATIKTCDRCGERIKSTYFLGEDGVLYDSGRWDVHYQMRFGIVKRDPTSAVKFPVSTTKYFCAKCEKELNDWLNEKKGESA